MAKKAEVEQVVADLEEIVEETEARRDQIWLDRMSLYLPSIISLSDTDNITVEKIVDEFVSGILTREKESNKPQMFGQRVIEVI